MCWLCGQSRAALAAGAGAAAYRFVTADPVLALLAGPAPGWNGAALGRPQAVTVSFATDALGQAGRGTALGAADWAPFSAAQRQAAREALASWSAAAGLTFVEVADTAAGRGVDVRFRLEALPAGVLGAAYFPRGGAVALDLDTFRGDALAPGGIGRLALLHEIGHAIGLKHPFDGAAVLPDEQSVWSRTVMAYDQGDAPIPGVIGDLDARAAAFLYGGPDAAAARGVTWGWDADRQAVRATGGAGDDAIAVLDYPVHLLDGGAGADRLTGGAGDDTLLGGPGDDLLLGLAGADFLVGGPGDDRLEGGDGDDELLGEAGGDVLLGGAGLDVLLGGDGDDWLLGGAGADALRGGAGRNRLQGGPGADVAEGEVAAFDALVLDGTRRATALELSVTGRRDGAPALSGRAVAADGAVDAFSGIDEIALRDGRLVFDPADPTARVERLYRAAFGREADSAALGHWGAALATGVGDGAVAAALAASGEFAGRRAGPPGTVAAGVLRDALGREADGAGLAWWTARLEAAGPGTLVAELAASAEAVARGAALAPGGLWDPDPAAGSLARLYLAAFGRPVDAGGFAWWRDALEAGTPLRQVARALIDDAEFGFRDGPLSNGFLFVGHVYDRALGRRAGGDEGAYWTDQIQRGLGREGFLLAVADSAEFAPRAAALVDQGIVFA